MPATSFIPLSMLIEDIGAWPGDQVELGAGVLGRVGVRDVSVTDTDTQTTLRFAAVFADEITLTIPGFSAVSLVLGSVGTESSFAFEVALREPRSVRLVDAAVGLRFEPGILRPVRETAAGFELDPARQFVQLTLTATLVFDEAGLRVDGDPALRLDPCMIGETGVVIEADAMKLDMSSSRSPAEAAAAGLAPTWRGLFIADALIHLPPGLSSSVASALHFQNCFIGSGGFTGRVALESPNPGELFGLPFDLGSLAIELRQNSLVECRIQGQLMLSFFDQPLEVIAGFDATGGIVVQLGAADGLVTLEKPGVLRLELTSVGFELEDGLFTVHLSGAITPLFGSLSWPTFEISDLSIDSEGHVRVEGGWIDLPSAVSFSLYGFSVEITKIGFGTDDDGTRWFGCSGGVRFVDDLSVGGSIEGLKIKWKGSDVSLELKGIGVELVIPDTLALTGKVEFIDEGTITGFKGSVQLSVMPLNFGIDAQLLIGRNSASPAYNFAYIFVAAELPVGIPLLNTGLGFFGFAGLTGYNVAPAKAANEEWFEWYLRSPVGVSGVDKWRDERGAFALGAGTTIGTLADNGYTFHGRFLLVLVLPGPLIMLDGRVAFLTARGGEPQFLTFCIFDGRAGTLLFNVQAHYRYPGSGDLVDITGFAEAFFDFAHPKKWHFYLGQENPESKRIRADIIKLFEGNSYFMLNHGGVRMGAWFGIDKKWKYGPLKVTLEAWIQGSASLSWSPAQFQGELTLHGDIGLKAFGRGASLSLRAELEARTPHPYLVRAEFKVKMNLPWPLPDPKAKVKLKWEEEVPPPPPKPLELLGVEHLKVSEKWVLAATPDAAPIVPLDARPVLSFQRRMSDRTGLAANALPQSSERVGSYRFRYQLDEIRLERRRSVSEAWVDASNPAAPSMPAGALWTQWQAIPSTSGDASPQNPPPMTKLMLWSRTPFDFAREAGGTAAEDGFLDDNPSWPCGYDWTPVMECAAFEDQPHAAMVPILPRERMVVVSRFGQIVKWGGDWVPVDRAAVISGSDISLKRAREHADSPRSPLIRIFLPPNAAALVLYAGRDTDGVILQPGREPRALTYTGSETIVEAGQENLTYVDLIGAVALLRLCWISRTEWDRVRDGMAAPGRLATTGVDALGADEQLLLPHQHYRLTATTRVERSDDGGDSWDTVRTYTDEGYFRTESAPGLAADVDDSGAGELEPAGDSEHYPARGPLRDLTPYVALTIPAHGEMAAYRAYDVRVEFNEAYTERLYLLDGTPLALHLRGANGESVRDASGEPLNLFGSWLPLDPAQTGNAERTEAALWREVLLTGGCVGGAIGDAPASQTMAASHPNLLLEPRRVYSAVLGPISPAAIVPLAVDGSLLLSEALTPIVLPYTGTLEEKLEKLQTASSGRKLLVANGVLTETSLGAEVASIRFDPQSFDSAVLAEIVKILDPPPGALLRVFDWTFTTSRYATFVHHMHSYRERVASRDDQLGNPGVDLLDATQLAWLTGLALARPNGVPVYPDEKARRADREVERQLFDRIMVELQMQDVPLPDELTFTFLDDHQRSYGLLMQSPEPLQWNRVFLALARHATAVSSDLIQGARAKISNVSFANDDTAASLVQEHVELVLLNSTSLQGYRIQVEDAAGNWVDHYTFVASDVLPAGTVVRVHTGSGADDGAPTPEVEHFYAAESGGAAARRFPDADANVRLVDPSGTPVHTRTLLRAAFGARTYKLIRSFDQTRALIFFRAGTQLGNVPTGTLRFDLGFRRNILPTEPILRRMGSDAPEATSLYLPVP